MIFTRDVLTNLKQYISGNVLDLGAGRSKYKPIFLGLDKVSSYTAFDVEGGDNVDVVGDIHDLPLEKNTFDTVVCTQVFEHIKEPWVVAEQIQKVLRPGGYAIITAPFMVPYHAHPHDYYRYTPDGIAHLFEKKMKVIEKGTYGKTYTVISELLRFEFLNPYKKHSKFRLAFWTRMIRFFIWLDRFSKSEDIYANVYIVVRK